MTGIAVILGGTGRFGRHAAEAFWNAGWTVRVFDRSRDDLASRAQGADVIVNAWNPAYPDWEKTVPELTTQVIEVAKSTGATVILPGNVYVYGAGSPMTLGVDTPHAARNPLGRVRVDMEAAYRASGVRTIILRAGDFIDTEPSGNWFDKVITAKMSANRVVYPGALDRAHAWAYLPDLAKAAVALAERRADLPVFTDIPFPGYTLSGHDLAQALSLATGRPLRVRHMAWWPIQLLQPVWPMARSLCEMRYLWDMPHQLDPSVMEHLLPSFRATPIEQALATALPTHRDAQIEGEPAIA